MVGALSEALGQGIDVNIERKVDIQNRFKPIEILNLGREKVFSINGFENSNPDIAISNFCLTDIYCIQYFKKVYDDAEKKNAFTNQKEGITMYVDNMNIYKDFISATTDKLEVQKQILAVYDLMGNEKSITIKNELLIVKYTDGSTERVYNVD